MKVWFKFIFRTDSNNVYAVNTEGSQRIRGGLCANSKTVGRKSRSNRKTQEKKAELLALLIPELQAVPQAEAEVAGPEAEAGLDEPQAETEDAQEGVEPRIFDATCDNENLETIE